MYQCVSCYQILWWLVRTLLRYSGDLMFFVCKLGFLKFKFLMTVGVKERHYSKLHGDRLNRCKDMVIFHFSKWQPSTMFNWLFTYLDHPQKLFGDIYICAKFCWNRCSSFDDNASFITSRLWLVNVYSPLLPQNVFWDVNHMTRRSSKSVYGCRLGAIPRIT